MLTDDGIGDNKNCVRTTTPTMQRLVRGGRSMILLVLLRAHATGMRLKYPGVFTGHDPTRVSGQGDFKMSRVGSGRVVVLENLTGRVGSGRIKKF